MSNSMKDDLNPANQHSSSSMICTQGLPNLIRLLRRRVQEHGEKTVFTYLKDGESQEATLTYCELNGGRSPSRHISNPASLLETGSFCSTPRDRVSHGFLRVPVCRHGRRAGLSPHFQPVPGNTGINDIRFRTDRRTHHYFHPGTVQTPDRSDIPG